MLGVKFWFCVNEMVSTRLVFSLVRCNGNNNSVCK